MHNYIWLCMVNVSMLPASVLMSSDDIEQTNTRIVLWSAVCGNLAKRPAQRRSRQHYKIVNTSQISKNTRTHAPRHVNTRPVRPGPAAAAHYEAILYRNTLCANCWIYFQNTRF